MNKTKTTAEKLPVCEMWPFPAIDRMLPALSSGLITKSLWRRITGSDDFKPNSPCEDELCFYVMFAVLGFIGHDRRKIANGESLLVPVAFGPGSFAMRLSLMRKVSSETVLILSLPEEEIPPV